VCHAFLSTLLAAGVIAVSACGENDSGDKGSRRPTETGPGVTVPRREGFTVINFDADGLTVDVVGSTTLKDALSAAERSTAECDLRPKRLSCRQIQAQRWRCRGDFSDGGNTHPEISVIC
jgi:hypothetical protein